MTRIICRALACLFWAKGTCTAEEMEYEPDIGCLTFQDIGSFAADEDEDLDWGIVSGELTYEDADTDWDADDAWEDEGGLQA